MPGRKEILIAFILTFSIVSGFGQDVNWKFEHLRKKEGLSNESVTAILQDKFGFIWIGTESGLNLYDSYSIVSFLHDEKDPASISNNYILCLAEDRDGNIYVGTRNGLNVYNRAQKTFTALFHDPEVPTSLSDNMIQHIYFDSRNNLWVGTRNGLNVSPVGENKFTRIFHDPSDPHSLPTNFIRKIYEDREGTMWFLSYSGLSRLDEDKVTFTTFTHDPGDPQSLSSNLVTATLEDRQGRFWVGTMNGGLNLFDRKTGFFRQFRHNTGDVNSLSTDDIAALEEDGKGNLWLATTFGLNIYNIHKNTFSRYYTTDRSAGLTSDVLSCIHISSSNKVWVGTRFGGVNIFDHRSAHMKHYYHELCNPNGLTHNNISAFAEDAQGDIWVATDGGGVFHFDREKEAFTSMIHVPGNPNSPAGDKALAIQVDRFGFVWIGYWGNGLDRYDPKTGKFTHYKHDLEDPASISDDNIFQILEDQKGNIWVTTWGNGTNMYNWDTDDFTTYPYDLTNSGALQLQNTVSLGEDHAGNIWVTSESDGFARIDPVTQKVINFPLENYNNVIPNSNLYAIHEDRQRRLWIGTNGSGLCLFDPEKDVMERFTTEDGLPSNTVVGILEDDHSNLWLSTYNGLSKFSPDQRAIENFHLSDGLQSNQFNRWAFLKLSTGEMVFGGVNGFNIFHPDSLKIDTVAPKVYLLDFKLFNKSVPIGESEILKKNIMFADKVNLQHNQNFFSIDYVALNFKKSEENQFKYILEGLNEDWVLAGQERKATYTNLDPGRYVFRVVASNSGGIWNSEGASVEINISPPFWNTWYFRMLVLLLICGFLYGIYQVRIKVIKAQKAALKREVHQKTAELQKSAENLLKINKELDQFAYIVSHDLKAPLRGVTSLAEWIEEDLGTNVSSDVQENLHHLKNRVGRMQSLIDGILNYSKAGRMNTEKATFSSREVVRDALQMLSLPEAFVIEVKGAFPEIYSNRTWIEQVFTNLISNAVKYHDKTEGKIVVEYTSNPAEHVFSVQDDGPGIPPEYHEKVFQIFQTLNAKDSKESTGIGLSIVKKIIEEHGGRIWIESDGKRGTKVCFILPKDAPVQRHRPVEVKKNNTQGV